MLQSLASIHCLIPEIYRGFLCTDEAIAKISPPKQQMAHTFTDSEAHFITINHRTPVQKQTARRIEEQKVRPTRKPPGRQLRPDQEREIVNMVCDGLGPYHSLPPRPQIAVADPVTPPNVRQRRTSSGVRRSLLNRGNKNDLSFSLRSLRKAPPSSGHSSTRLPMNFGPLPVWRLLAALAQCTETISWFSVQALHLLRRIAVMTMCLQRAGLVEAPRCSPPQTS